VGAFLVFLIFMIVVLSFFLAGIVFA